MSPLRAWLLITRKEVRICDNHGMILTFIHWLELPVQIINNKYPEPDKYFPSSVRLETPAVRRVGGGNWTVSLG